ncbi:MAG: cytochrome c [Dehalogenimonas sp.]
MRKKVLYFVVPAVILIFGGLVTACVPKTISPTDLADASQIFSNDCASCHKSDRTGSHGPDITAPELKDYTQASLAEFLIDHKTAKNLTTAQHSALAEWLKGP